MFGCVSSYVKAMEVFWGRRGAVLLAAIVAMSTCGMIGVGDDHPALLLMGSHCLVLPGATVAGLFTSNH